MNRTQEQVHADYLEFRGRCKELSEAAVTADPSLTLVRGHYFCPLWGTEEPHWWTKRQDGTIYDPSCRQFPSNGKGTYEEFDGIVYCEECGTGVPEDEAVIDGAHGFCSSRCYGVCIGMV